MSQTFEELATRELDSLYQGALFLTAGDESEAEQLLVETLGASFRRFHSDDSLDDVGTWLEGRMASAFMAGHMGGPHKGTAPTPTGPGFDPSAFAALDAAGLNSAAATVPWAARAALWLVLLRRWTYAAASEALGVDQAVLRDLLEYRHTLMGAILGGKRRRTGVCRSSLA